MNIKRFVTNPIGENCYVVWDETHEAAIIDCGAWEEDKHEKIAHFIEENGLRPVLSLQTHMHFDHILGAPLLQKRYGLQPLCHASEQPVYDFLPTMTREWFGMQVTEPLVPVKEYLTDGQELTFGHLRLRVLHTPGHTPGGLCFYFPDQKALFSGDTLFQGSIGRSDLPGGSHQALVQAVRSRLLSLPDDTVVYPGHGPSTTIAYERQFNPYL